MNELKILLLGFPKIYLDGKIVNQFNTQKDRGLLAYLAATGTTHSREILAYLFWPDILESNAKRNLRHAISHLRKAIGPAWIDTAQGVAMTHGLPWSVDVQILQSMMDKLDIEQSSGTYNPNTINIDALHKTLNLYQGEFLQGFQTQNAAPFEEWVLARQEEYHRLALRGLEILAECCLVQREYTIGLSVTRRLLELEPWSEIAHRQQMRLLVETGCRVAALQQFETCRQILDDEFGLAPESETMALYEQICNGGFDYPNRQEDQAIKNINIQPPISNNLPAALIPLIGYSDELAYIEKQLMSIHCRLLTILGIGGMGKTHLALETARRIVDAASGLHFGDGVYFIPLDTVEELSASAAAEEAIVNAIASAIGYNPQGAESLQTQLQLHLQKKRMLLILDNMEHLLAGSHMITQLLQYAGQLSILCTSREKLDLQGEHTLALHGLYRQLDVEGHHHKQSGGSDQTNAALALFAYRAQLANPHFQIDRENRVHIEQICELVDGLPLGIELAARWLESLDCQIIAHEISLSLEFLKSSRRDSPSRHHTLRAVFEPSWQRLGLPEQTTLARLSIFRPNFQPAAAKAITGASLDNLSTLVNQSLLKREANGCLSMHRSIRYFAREKLHQSTDSPQVLKERYVSLLSRFHCPI